MRDLRPVEYDMHLDDERENPTPRGAGFTNKVQPAVDVADEAWSSLAAEQQEEDLYLRELVGVADLHTAKSLQVVVNTHTNSISHLGRKLRVLEELNLNNSVMESLRDLGTGFRLLQVLWVSRCGLTGFEGLSALPRLRELYASYNDVADLHALDGSVPELEVLDLEGNCISDLDAVQYLASCPALTSLVMTGNPAVGDGGEAYRAAVVAVLPGLHSLDDAETAAGSRHREHLEEVAIEEQVRAAKLQREPLRNGEAAAAEAASAAAAAAAAAAVAEWSRQRCISGQEASSSSSSVSAAELALVRDAIKHARVGVDSLEFRELEMGSLLQGDANFCQALEEDGSLARPTSSSVMMPVSGSAWMRTLRSSQSGSLAALRSSRQASTLGPAADGRDRAVGSSSGEGSLGWSRPPSAPDTGAADRSAVQAALTPRRQGSCGGIDRRPGSGRSSGTGGTATAGRPPSSERPFTSRPGSGATAMGLFGAVTVGSSAAAPSISTLYWRKHRVGAASGGGISGSAGPGLPLPPGSGRPGSAMAASAAASGAGEQEEEGEDDSSSTLTHGSDARSTFGGSFVRDLKRWKYRAQPGSNNVLGRPLSADEALSSSSVAGDVDGYISASHHHLVSHEPLCMKNGSMGRDELLEELRRWKLHAADKALQREDEASVGPAAFAWGADTPADALSADILDLGRIDARAADDADAFSTPIRPPNGVRHSATELLLAPSPLQVAQLAAAGHLSGPQSPMSPAPLSPVLPPHSGRRRTVLGKVMQDAKDLVALNVVLGASSPLPPVTKTWRDAGGTSSGGDSSSTSGYPHHHHHHYSSGGTGPSSSGSHHPERASSLHRRTSNMDTLSRPPTGGDESMSLYSRPGSREEPDEYCGSQRPSPSYGVQPVAAGVAAPVAAPHAAVLAHVGRPVEVDMLSSNPRPLAQHAP